MIASFVHAHWLALTYGAASAAVLLFAIVAGGRAATWLAGMLLAGWLVFNLLSWNLPEPLAWTPLPFMDLGFLIIALGLGRAYEVKWPLVLAALFMVQLAMHLAFWWSWLQQPISAQPARAMLKHNYALWLNLTFILQLVCVSWPGAVHVVGTVGSWGRPGLLSDRGSGA